MPVPELVTAVSRARTPEFVVVDAAQAVNHMTLSLTAPESNRLTRQRSGQAGGVGENGVGDGVVVSGQGSIWKRSALCH